MENYLPGNNRLSYLLERYRINACTREEMDELLRLIEQVDEHMLLPSLYKQWEKAQAAGPAEESDWDLLYQAMMAQTQAPDAMDAPVRRRRRLRSRRRWLTGVASLLLLAGAGIVFRLSHPAVAAPSHNQPIARRYKNDVKPGGNKAVLTLADGSTIVLDSAGNGMLSMQGNTKVLKLAGGQLAYQGKGLGVAASPVYNMISTPRGGQYQITLPDGSKVWLDAGSSLRFPTSFTGSTREVQLTGEAYFEVSHDSHQPFMVAVFSDEPGKGRPLQQVEVLGTSFNIMAYAEETMMKTTLLEGEVQIGDAVSRPVRLKPGDQAQQERVPGMTLRGAALRVVQDADVDAAVAWKNGYFDFNKADIETIMRQLARWYDVDISFRGNGGRDKQFFGGIQRNLPLSAILRILEKSGVAFSIDGKKVIVDL